jgi:hypothetical protein
MPSAVSPYWFALMPAERMSYTTSGQHLDSHSGGRGPRGGRAGSYQIKAFLTLPDPREDGFDLLEIPHIAAYPLDLGISVGLLFYLLDRLFTLVSLSVDHDDAGAIEDEGTGDFVT